MWKSNNIPILWKSNYILFFVNRYNAKTFKEKSYVAEPGAPGAPSLCLEPEPTQISHSRLRDLGPEDGAPKKVAAPQHWENAHRKTLQPKIILNT